MGVYMEAFYHFVWATRKREWFITEAMERELYRYIENRCRSMKVRVYALNGIADHVHLVVSLPTSLSAADFMETIKGASAHFINHLPNYESCLYWQSGYGLLTFTKDDLPRIVRYVERQKIRHSSGNLSAKMERTADWEISPTKNTS
jgi:putative transposase